MKSYDEKRVTAFFKAHGIPAPVFEHRLYKPGMRQPSRFDLAWLDKKVYLEVQGGIWKPKQGHNTGKGIRQDWLKYNYATTQGWRPLFCEPDELFTQPVVDYIKTALMVEEAGFEPAKR